jgi:hypothetical protein
MATASRKLTRAALASPFSTYAMACVNAPSSLL